VRTNGYVVFASLVLPNGMHHRWAPISECRRMEQRGECARLIQPGKKSIGATRPVFKLVAQAEPSKSMATAPALSWEDTLLNVGVDPKPHRERGLSRDRMREVRSKVREYGMSSPRQALA